MGPKSVSPFGWAGKGPSAALSRLNGPFCQGRFVAPPCIRAFSGPSRGHYVLG